MKHIVLGDRTVPLKWDGGALYRADEIDLPQRMAAGQFGFSTLCKMIWVMLSDEERAKHYASPDKVATALKKGQADDAWTVVMAAWSEGNGVEDSPAKNVVGSGSPSPSSSSS